MNYTYFSTHPRKILLGFGSDVRKNHKQRERERERGRKEGEDWERVEEYRRTRLVTFGSTQILQTVDAALVPKRHCDARKHGIFIDCSLIRT